MLSKLFQSKNKRIARLFYNKLFCQNSWSQDEQKEIYKLIREYNFNKENRKLLSIVLASIVKKFATTEKNCEVDLEFELKIIYYLLEKGADSNTEFKDDKAIYKDIRSALQEDDNREIYQFKLGQCGRYNDLDKDVVNDKIRLHHITFSNFTTSSITALHIAAYYGAIGLVDELLERRADVNAKDRNGNTAMHLVLAYIVKKKNFFRKVKYSVDTLSSQFEVLKLLTLAGANTNISIHCANFSGCNSMHYDYRPIYLAVVCNELDLVSTLIEYGADMHFIDAFGHSLLNYAIRQENHVLVKLLLDNGANVNQRYNKKTVLEYAVEHKMWYISFLLLMKKYYHDTEQQTLPLLYRTMELCIKESLSEDLMMENLDNFTSTVVENDYLLEEELSKWESYLQSTYVPSNLKTGLNNLCGSDVLQGIVKEALDSAKKALEDVVKEGINRLTNIMEKIEQCSIQLERSQSLDTILQTQCLPEQNEDAKKSKSTWQLFFHGSKSKEVNSHLDKIRISKSAVELREV